MRKTTIIFAAIAMMVFFSFAGVAQTPVNTAAGAKVVPALTLAENAPMHFGTMTVKSYQGGTCVVSTAGVRSRTGGVTLQNLAPLMSLATYTVSGEPLRTYAITLPSAITITFSTYSMTINSLLAKSTSGAQSHNATGTLALNGTEQFTIGATLNVAAGQAEGLYQGTFDVTVAYN